MSNELTIDRSKLHYLIQQEILRFISPVELALRSPYYIVENGEKQYEYNAGVKYGHDLTDAIIKAITSE